MPAPLDDLGAVLAAEAAECRDLLPLLEDEFRALLQADVPALLEIGARREAAVAQLNALEQRRQRAVGDLATALGLPAPSVTLSSVLGTAPEAAARLLPIRNELRELLVMLRTLHGRNRFLAEHTLSCLRGLFSSLVAALAPAPTYADSGRARPSAQELRLLDRRA
ncbi:MAG TPA: flagellar protein FlgN [Candidatus Bathyarchaeia archaeon]|nr:flagellar protein FlgN [Candidatus Bathyarchaeia archaeon]